jgi:hypothetical protein
MAPSLSALVGTDKNDSRMRITRPSRFAAVSTVAAVRRRTTAAPRTRPSQPSRAHPDLMICAPATLRPRCVAAWLSILVLDSERELRAPTEIAGAENALRPACGSCSRQPKKNWELSSERSCHLTRQHSPLSRRSRRDSFRPKRTYTTLVILLGEFPCRMCGTSHAGRRSFGRQDAGFSFTRPQRIARLRARPRSGGDRFAAAYRSASYRLISGTP